MKKLKKIIGYFLLITTMPFIIGLTTLDGKLCSYGNCEDVYPFWGGLIAVFLLEIFAAMIMGMFFLIIRLID